MDEVVAVYLTKKELLTWCFTIQDVCQSFDDDDPDKEPLVVIRDKLLEAMDCRLESFFDSYDRFHIRPTGPNS